MATAEDRRSIATYGATHRINIWLSGPAREVRALKGPVFADHSAIRRDHSEALWAGKRPIRITLASDSRLMPEVAARLQALARTDQVELCVGPRYVGDRTEGVSRLSYEGLDGTSFDGVIRVGSAQHALWLQEGWQTLARSWQGTEDLDEIEGLYLDHQAHRSLQNDIFVTTNPYLLDERFGSAWFANSGIFSPREALTAVEAILRGRRTITPLLEPKYGLTVNDGLFYGYVTEARLPHVYGAVRSCLSTTRHASSRPLADHTLNILDRYRSLLVASDALYRIALTEGHMHGHNGILREQLYHLQYAVVLVAGTLDHLAWIIADIERTGVHRKAISWRAIREQRKWIANLTSTDARMIATAARTHASAELMDFVYDLRDAVQHRRPLQADVVEVQGRPLAIGRVDGPSEARIVMLDVNSSLAPIAYPTSLDAPGAILFGGRPYLVAHAFMRGVAAALAHMLDEVFAALPWSDASGWWEPDERMYEEHLELVKACDWLFGPLGIEDNNL